MAAYVVMLGALLGLVALPLGVYRGVVLDRRYGLSSQGVLGWLGEHVKTVGVTAVIAAAAAVLMYSTLQLWPNRWWVISGLVFTLAVVSLNHLGPVLLLPLMYRCSPIERRALRVRLESLVHRAGTSVLRARRLRVAPH